MARASLCKYFVRNFVLVVTLLCCHDINAVSFQNLLAFLLPCHWYFIRQGQVSEKTSIIPSLSSFPRKQNFKFHPFMDVIPGTEMMFSHGATSYDRNKMVPSFPIGVTQFLHPHSHMVLSMFRHKLDFKFCVCEMNPIECHHSYEFIFFTSVWKKFCNIKYKFYMYFLWCSVTIESVDEIQWCDYLRATCLPVLLQGVMLFILIFSSIDFWVCGWNFVVLPFKWNLHSSF